MATRLSRNQVELVLRLAEREPHTGDWGEVKAEAARVGMNYDSLKALVSHARGGHRPRYWDKLLKETP